MSKTVNLLEGRILPALVRLAVPITATALIQMAYNLTDMIWIGRLGSNQVAAVGAAGMYSWLAAGLATMCRMGGQVKTAQSLGAREPSDVARYAKTALILGLLAGIIFGGAAGLLHRPLIGFFHLNSPQVIADAEIYMIITCGGIVFNYINQIMTGLLTASGNSTAPFLATTVGLVSNIALDPLLIFGLGPIPALGVMGAAIATVFAQLVVMVIMIYFASRDTVLFVFIRWREKLRGQDILQVVKIGLPTAVQSMIFSAIFYGGRPVDRGMGRRCGSGAEGWKPDRIHLMDDGGWILCVHQRVYRTELWCGQQGTGAQGLLYFLCDCCHLGNFYDADADSFSRTSFSDIHYRGGCHSDGRGVSEDSGLFSALYVS